MNKHDIKKSIAEKLFMARRSRKISRKKLAELAGVKVASIISAEDDTKFLPRMEPLIKICSILNLSIDELVWLNKIEAVKEEIVSNFKE